jgi:hypothetical protein
VSSQIGVPKRNLSHFVREGLYGEQKGGITQLLIAF